MYTRSIVNSSLVVILKTTDSGANWTAQTSGTTNWLSSVYFTDANTGYAVGAGGTILKTTDGGGTFVERNMQETPALHIYPNPFSTTAKIILPESFNTGTFILYDVFGRKVMQREINKKTLEIQKGNLASGVYFYRVWNDDEVYTGKIIRL